MEVGLHPKSIVLLVALRAEPTGLQVCTGVKSVRTLQFTHSQLLTPLKNHERRLAQWAHRR